MLCLTKGLREGLTDYNHTFIILSLQAQHNVPLLERGRVGFGCVSDTTAVNLCNKETDLPFSSSSSGMTLLRSHLVSVGSQLYMKIPLPAYLRLSVQIYKINPRFSRGKAESAVWISCLCTQQGFHNEEVSHHITWMERDKSSLTLICWFFLKYLST